MAVLRWVIGLACAALPFVGCGPNPKPGEPCDGPTFNLYLKAPMGPLPQDTRLLVKYGGNNDGEPYALGETPAPQVVFCSERAQGAGGAAAEEAAAGQPAHAAGGKARTEGGAGQADAESPEGQGPDGVYSLYCRLYTQGPARIDVTASGYVAIEDRDLTLGKKSCLVDIELELTPLPLLLPDAGS